MKTRLAIWSVLVGTLALITVSASAQGPFSGLGGASKPQCDGLVGTWVNQSATIDLRKDGSTEFNGVRYRYAGDGKIITLVGIDGTYRYPYQLKGDTLIMLINGVLQTFQCGAAGAAPSGGGMNGNMNGGNTYGGAAGGITPQLLLSSAWCTFSYNKITGYSNSTRYVFSSNGTFSTGGRAEGSSSGYGGSMASQRNSQAAGVWKVANGVLYIGDSVPQPVETQIKRNNNGSVIVVADGVEYSQCR